VVEIVHSVGLTGAQLHGREPAAEVQWVRERVPLVIQAFSAGDGAIATATEGGADIVMLDAAEPGSGRVFDWALAEGVPRGARLMLAGGLTPENVGDAVMRVRPWGVDVSTGVETSPGSGRKDAPKVRRFVERAREAFDQLVTDGWSPAEHEGAAYDWRVDERPV
jgi:phosphoribosylanthranilate isomerase